MTSNAIFRPDKSQESESACSREFVWVSSAKAPLDILDELDKRMARFYGEQGARTDYQTMLDAIDEEIESPGGITGATIEQICRGAGTETNVLEIGCGNGRLYRQMRGNGYRGRYLGVEVAEYIIERNRGRHPEASWRQGSIYNIEEADHAFDVVVTFYVLEHTVYPERALLEMLRVLKPGGRMVLVFPDFVASGMLPSQKTGFSVGPAGVKLRRGQLFDAALSLYDNRIRLPKALREAVAKRGPFPINLRPLCLSRRAEITADVDATYIASKNEVRQWFQKQGHHVELPCGKAGLFKLHSLLTVTRNGVL